MRSRLACEVGLVESSLTAGDRESSRWGSKKQHGGFLDKGTSLARSVRYESNLATDVAFLLVALDIHTNVCCDDKPESCKMQTRSSSPSPLSLSRRQSSYIQSISPRSICVPSGKPKNVPSQVQVSSRAEGVPIDWYGERPRHSATVTSLQSWLASCSER